MKLGIGLYTHILNRDNLLFTKQTGATHVLAHTPFSDSRKPGD
jgi:mannonate dehydratase